MGEGRRKTPRKIVFLLPVTAYTSQNINYSYSHSLNHLQSGPVLKFYKDICAYNSPKCSKSAETRVSLRAEMGIRIEIRQNSDNDEVGWKMDVFITPDDEEEEEALITEIEQEMRKIYLTVEKLYNNASLSELSDPIDKCFISNYYYSSSLLARGVTDEVTGKDALKVFEENLQQELNFLTNDMDKLLTKMNEYKEQLNSIDRNISNVSAMMESQRNESKPDNNLSDLMRNIRLRFRREKADLKSIVFRLFPESYETQNLIARIIEHHFDEGTDKYLQLEDSDNVTEQIELLRRTRLFETNPHDPLQIRLANVL